MNYRFKMSIPEEKAYHEFLLEEFRKICLSAKSGEDIFGSSADVKAHTSMGNVYYAYFIGAKDLERCKSDTAKIRHEYINEKIKEAQALWGFRWMQEMYHAVGEVFQAYSVEQNHETAQALIAVVNGKYEHWRSENE